MIIIDFLTGSLRKAELFFAWLVIIKSVDSICRDSADTQYMLIQTNFPKSPKQLTYKPL